jgi:Zn-dependent protease with chaperone function
MGLVGAFVAVAGLVLARVWGARLLARTDDPAFAERLQVVRGRLLAFAFGGTVAVLVPTPGWGAAWIPVIDLAVAWGWFPTRRRLFEETWGFGSYLLHHVVLLAVQAGAPLILSALPLVGALLPPAVAWPVALLVAAGLVYWALAQPAGAIRLLAAHRIDRPDLAPRFDAILARASIPRPLILGFGPRGGTWPNALALAGTGRSAVVLGDTLVERLGPDEIAAIFAHEVAHLEHLSGAALRRARRLVLPAIVLVAVAGPAARLWSHTAALLVAIAVPLVAILLVPLLIRHHRAHESETDLRAVELCGGDGEALVRALIGLHALARIPRRWAVDVEQWATHPSLARRVQAIRRKTRAAEPAPRAPTVVRGARGTWVVLDADAAHWLEGVPAGTPALAEAAFAAASSRRAVRYEDLAALAFRPRLGGAALAAIDREGRRWDVPLRPEDVGLLQTALDEVDARLGTSLGARPPGRWTPAIGLLVSLLPGTPPWLALPALLALVRPAAAPLAALGAMATAGAALTAVRGVEGPFAAAGATLSWMVVVLLGALAVPALVGALRLARLGPGPRSSLRAVTVSLIGAAALVAAIRPAASILVEPSWSQAQAAAHSGASTALLLIALAVAGWLHPRPAARGAALGCAITAVALLVVGSNVVRDATSADPLLARLRAERGPAARPARLARVPVPPTAWGLRLSPRGTRAAVGTVAPLAAGQLHDLTATSQFLVREVRSRSADWQPVAALDLRFVDEDTALVAARGTGGIEVRLVSLGGATAAPGGWHVTIPPLVGAQLATDPGRRTWRLRGDDPATDELVRVAGTLGSPAVQVTRWHGPPIGAGAYSDNVVGPGDEALDLERLATPQVEGAAHDLRQHPQRRARRHRIAATHPDRRRVSFRALPELPQQLLGDPRLPDSCRPRHQHRTRHGLQDALAPQVVQRPKLALAAHARGRPPQDEPVVLGRLSLGTQAEGRADRLDLEAAVEQARGQIVHPDRGRPERRVAGERRGAFDDLPEGCSARQDATAGREHEDGRREQLAHLQRTPGGDRGLVRRCAGAR